MTKFVIAQRIASVMDSDRIIVMEEGRIDGFGTHAELMASNAIYGEIYRSQIKEGDDGHDAA
jgi:ATP-binding cassette subfamily B protein